MRVLVTGGAGFIGSHLVRALVARGDTVRVLDNLSSGKRSNLDGVEAELIEGDIRDLEVVRGALRGLTHVIHLAALVSVPRSVAEPLFSNAVNVVGTLNVLVAARDLGLRRVVLASSSAVYGDGAEGVKHEALPLFPISPYGVDKLAAEKYLAAFTAMYGLETVALRYFNVFGPRQDPRSEYAAVIPKFITALLAGRRPVIFGDGEQTRDFTYVENVVWGNLLALEAAAVAGQALNLATGVSVTLNSLAAMLAEVVGRPDLAADHGAPRQGDIRHSSANIERASALLAYRPQVDLREGLMRAVAGYRGPAGQGQ
jgi:nucleoside-diphosphate-sugar epimerase